MVSTCSIYLKKIFPLPPILVFSESVLQRKRRSKSGEENKCKLAIPGSHPGPHRTRVKPPLAFPASSLTLCAFQCLRQTLPKPADHGTLQWCLSYPWSTAKDAGIILAKWNFTAGTSGVTLWYLLNLQLPVEGPPAPRMARVRNLSGYRSCNPGAEKLKLRDFEKNERDFWGPVKSLANDG